MRMAPPTLPISLPASIPGLASPPGSLSEGSQGVESASPFPDFGAELRRAGQRVNAVAAEDSGARPAPDTALTSAPVLTSPAEALPEDPWPLPMALDELDTPSAPIGWPGMPAEPLRDSAVGAGAAVIGTARVDNLTQPAAQPPIISAQEENKTSPGSVGADIRRSGWGLSAGSPMERRASGLAQALDRASDRGTLMGLERAAEATPPPRGADTEPGEEIRSPDVTVDPALSGPSGGEVTTLVTAQTTLAPPEAKPPAATTDRDPLQAWPATGNPPRVSPERDTTPPSTRGVTSRAEGLRPDRASTGPVLPTRPGTPDEPGGKPTSAERTPTAQALEALARTPASLPAQAAVRDNASPVREALAAAGVLAPPIAAAATASASAAGAAVVTALRGPGLASFEGATIHRSDELSLPPGPELARPGGAADLSTQASPMPPLGSVAAPVPSAFSTAQVTTAPTFAETSLPARWDTPEFLPALSRQIAFFARDGVEHARVHLNPTEMGPIQVQLALDGTQVRLDLSAEAAATRQLLEQSLPQLASSLREGGFTLAGGGVFQQPREAAEGRGDGRGGGLGDGRGPQEGRSPPGSPGGDAGPGGGSRPAPVRVRHADRLVDLYA